MPTAEEIVVALRSEGAQQTQADLQNVDSQLDETKGSLGETSEEMQGFSQKMRGAMSTVVAGLAIATAGLLAQVPVVGEVMSGLFAIIDALALRLDSVLRPALTPITNELFNLSSAIIELNGPLGTLLDATLLLGTGLFTVAAGAAAVGAVVPSLTAFGAVGAVFGAAATAAGSLAAAATTLKTALVGLASTISGGIGLGLIIGLSGVAVLELTGLMDTVRELGRTIGTLLPDWARDGLLALIGIFAGPLAVIGAMIAGFVDGALEGGLMEGIRRAVTFGQRALNILVGAFVRTTRRMLALGRDLIDFLVKGIVAGGGQLWSASKAVAHRIESGIMDTDWIQLGENIIGSVIDGIRNMAGQAADAAGDVAGRIRDHLPSSPAKEGPLSDIDEAGPALVNEFATGIEANAGRLENAAASAAGAASPGDQNPRRAGAAGGFMAERRPSPTILVDGKDVTQETGRWRRDETSRRGRES